ncbi:HpyAIV family type II restriction enzyme [Mycoplasma sp. HS2188]|uniref:HpyAIV family type II restriction enzyme n=1 Tax=Mycoplasma sp. HS2188 TaxID=2976765 RepID=UPI0021A9F509|nr:hypothetical protein [Mycoplasma sp. HS2188]MCT4469526.1 hypothetical protein [Mycoplasma sp. HS2188]
MDYTSFELKLRSILNNGNGPKLLLKLIESPYRFNSNLHPFNIVTKLEQSFLRAQENNYYKFIVNCAEEIFYSNLDDIEHLKNSFKLDYVIDRDNLDDMNSEEIIDKSEVIKFRTSIAFRNSTDKEMTLIFARKRDTFSQKKADEFIEQSIIRAKALSQGNPDWKIKYIVWFIDPLYISSKEKFDNFTNNEHLQDISISFRYGADLFSDYMLENKWREIEDNINLFKEKNEDFFLKMPNLSTDKETLEFMITMSDNAWEKLSSFDPDMVKLREIVFDNENENSNFKKASRMRIQVLNDSSSELNE